MLPPVPVLPPPFGGVTGLTVGACEGSVVAVVDWSAGACVVCVVPSSVDGAGAATGADESVTVWTTASEAPATPARASTAMARAPTMPTRATSF